MNNTVVRIAAIVVVMVFTFAGGPEMAGEPTNVARRPGMLPTLDEDDIETLMAADDDDLNPGARAKRSGRLFWDSRAFSHFENFLV